MARLLVLTGPPAAGKTTVAAVLAARRPRSVHLHADDFWGFVRNGYIEPWLPAARQQNETVIRAVCTSAVVFTAGGYDVVLDGVVGPWLLAELRAAARPPGVRVDYAVLLPPLEVVLAQLVGRSGHGFTSRATTVTMYEEFQRGVEGFERHVLDPAGRSPQQLADAVEAAAAAGQLGLPLR